MKTKKIIVVLGMHRSGTSAVTRGLKCLGVSLGDTLLQPFEGVNDRGFWEDIDIVLLNEEILSFLKTTWHDISEISAADFNKLIDSSYFGRATELLNTKVKGTTLFGLKDPRLARLLPFWKAVIKHCGIEVNYLLIYRNPLSVAKSLRKRDNFDEGKSYLLWLSSMLSIFNETSEEVRILVNYDHLIHDPDAVLTRISQQFGLVINPSSAVKYKTEFLTSELRHDISDISDLMSDANCPALLKEMYADIESQYSLGQSVFFEKLPLWANEFKKQEAVFKLIDRIYEQKIINEYQIKQLMQRNMDLEPQRAELEQHIEGLAKHSFNLEQHSAQLEQQIDELAKHNLNLEQHGAQLEQRVALLTERINALISSTSWRLTVPLRWLGTQRLKIINKNKQ